MDKEWVLLSDDGFHDFNEDGEKHIFLGKWNSGSKSDLDSDYIICPSPNSPRFTELTRNPRVTKQLVPVPIRLEPRIGKTPDDDLVKEITKSPTEVSVIPSSAATEIIKASQIGAVEADQDTASQVFFKKMKENEFVDMKMDSPRSSSREMLPAIDTGALNFEDKGETLDIITSPRMKFEKEILLNREENEDSTWKENNDEFNLGKWRLTGIGAICGFTVATICVLFFGSQQRNKFQQNPKIRFQICTDDKKIKQVGQHATKWNEAISAVRGVPLTRAHITYGGYYDGL